MPEVYITRTASFMPNSPISNDEIEEYLGFINGAASKTRALILRNNKIKSYLFFTKDSKKIKHVFNEYWKENGLIKANNDLR